MDYQFDAKKVKEQLIEGIRDWFEKNGDGCKSCVAMSGGKDSTIVAKLCVEALGADRVIGIGIPDKGQGLNEADAIAEWMGITFKQVRIDYLSDAIRKLLKISSTKITDQADMNVPPRLRMLML